MKAEIFPLPKPFPFVSLITLAFIATHFPSRFAFLLTFSPYLLSFYSSCACLPVFPSPSPLLTLSTAKPWSLTPSSFPEPLLCVSRGNRGAHWISPCPQEVHNSVEPLPYGPTIHMGPYDVRGVGERSDTIYKCFLTRRWGYHVPE